MQPDRVLKGQRWNFDNKFVIEAEEDDSHYKLIGVIVQILDVENYNKYLPLFSQHKVIWSYDCFINRLFSYLDGQDKPPNDRK